MTKPTPGEDLILGMKNAVAHARGQKRASRETIVLTVGEYDDLMRLLEAPPLPNGALKRLLLGKSPWEK